MSRRDLPANRRGGFTLIEVLFALAILAIVLGGIFGVVRSTLKADKSLRHTQVVREGVTGIFNLCQQTFPSLPPAARVVWSGSGGPGEPGEVAFLDAPQAFAIDSRNLFFGETALVTRAQPNGALVLGLEYRRLDRHTRQALPDPLWIPLLRDLHSVAWSFYEPSVGQWLPQWPDFARRPALIRLTLVLLGSPREWSATFWLPQLRPVALATGSPPAPPS